MNKTVTSVPIACVMLMAHWLLLALKRRQGLILQYDPSGLLQAAKGRINLQGFIAVDRHQTMNEHLYSSCKRNTKEKACGPYE